jgi:hypothetical protein
LFSNASSKLKSRKEERKMKMNKVALLIGFAIASVLFLEVAAHADEIDESTKVTFSKPVQIPGQVLPAGTYLFKLADSNDLNLVQIDNAEGTRVYATLQTVSTERREPTGSTVLVMAIQGPGRPEALLKWFYPGNLDGHEFLYSNQQEQQLAQDRQQTIVAKQAAEAGD